MPNPQTLSLEAAEWSALAMFNVNAISGNIGHLMQQGGGLIDDHTAAQLKGMLGKADRLIEAWRRASQQQIAMQEHIKPHMPEQQVAVNGPAVVKRRGKGWPKGKKRKPVQPQESQPPN